MNITQRGLCFQNGVATIPKPGHPRRYFRLDIFDHMIKFKLNLQRSNKTKKFGTKFSMQIADFNLPFSLHLLSGAISIPINIDNSDPTTTAVFFSLFLCDGHMTNKTKTITLSEQIKRRHNFERTSGLSRILINVMSYELKTQTKKAVSTPSSAAQLIGMTTLWILE